eukprot:4062636-Alexandrium_andersonii.AAC.1
MRFPEHYRERRAAKLTWFPQVWLMAAKELTVLERDYLDEHALIWPKSRENDADIEGRPRPFAM